MTLWLFNLMAYSPATKHVFIVDDDIDVTNEADVLWALATRSCCVTPRSARAVATSRAPSWSASAKPMTR